MDFTTFMFLTNNSSSGLLSDSESEAGLLSNNSLENMCSILTMSTGNGGFDAFGGKDFFGSPDLSNLNENFFAIATQTETVGSVAYNTAETVGSVAYSSAETVGSVAFAGVGADAGASCSSDGGGSFSSFC